MKTLLAAQQSELQKKSNDYVKYQFIMAMMNMDERMIKPLLSKNFKFNGNMNDWHLLHWLKSRFEKFYAIMHETRHEEGISLDVYPGANMLEFCYIPMELNNGLPNTSESGKLRIRFVLLYENGEISELRVPKMVLSIEKTKKCQNEN